jgi:sugar phosphate isomerase/epimerase
MRPALRGLVGCALLGVLCLVAVGARADGPETGKTAVPLYAFDNGTGHEYIPIALQAVLLKEVGYDGIAYTGTKQIPEMLDALDARGLRMLSIYVDVNLKPEKGKPAFDPGLRTAIKRLKGHGTQIWLPIVGGRPSSTNLDDRAVAVVRKIAGWADESSLQVVLYPHFGNYVERVEDAVRLAKKVDRKNVGVIFNLCHFLKVDSEKNLERRLKEARPYLFAVSINGADGGETNKMDWDRLIQTLDRGSFDVGRVLAALKKIGYTGPFGLQCYGTSGDTRGNLERSLKAWRSLTARASAD